MATKLLTILIVAAVLAGSAAASLRVAEPSVASAPVSAARTWKAEPASGGSSVLLVAPNDRFVIGAVGRTQRPPRIVIVKR